MKLEHHPTDDRHLQFAGTSRTFAFFMEADDAKRALDLWNRRYAENHEDYRDLRDGETIRGGDEVLIGEAWEPSIWAGKTFVSYNFARHRRPWRHD